MQRHICWGIVGLLALLSVAFGSGARREVTQTKPTPTPWPTATPHPALLRAFAYPRTTQIYTLALSPDGNTIVTIETDYEANTRVLRWHDARDWKTLLTLKATPAEFAGWVEVLAFSPDGKSLAALDGMTIKILDAANGQTLKKLKLTASSARQLAFSSDGKLLAGCDGYTVYVWDVKASRVLWWHRDPASESSARQFYGLAFSPDGALLATAGGGERDNKGARLWDAHTGKLVRVLDGAYSLDPPLVFSHDGRTLATGGFPPGFKFRQYQRGRGGEGPAATESFWIGQYDLVVMLWDVETGKLKNIIRETPLPVRSSDSYNPLQFSPDDQQITVRGYSNLDVREVATGNLLQRVKRIIGYGGTLSADGKTYVTSDMNSAGNTIKVWRVPGLQPAATQP